ncbi:MAG: hypothetical protein P8N28_06440 [Phycisphaerales bacterium]|nr:hypothetical protein [Phycisphaerales bacterium]
MKLHTAFAEITISRIVIDAIKGTPVESALVTLQATSTQTTRNQKSFYSLIILSEDRSMPERKRLAFYL